MKIHSTTTLTAPAAGATAGQIWRWLADVPGEATVTAVTEAGDRGGSGSTRFTASWDTEIGDSEA